MVMSEASVGTPFTRATTLGRPHRASVATLASKTGFDGNHSILISSLHAASLPKEGWHGARAWGMHDLAERLAFGTNLFHYPSLLIFGAKSNIGQASFGSFVVR